MVRALSSPAAAQGGSSAAAEALSGRERVAVMLLPFAVRECSPPPSGGLHSRTAKGSSMTATLSLPLSASAAADDPPCAAAGLLNALTIDVEDYYHVSGFDHVVRRDRWAD